MKKDSVIWLVAGIFAFGLGLFGGRIFDRPTERATSPGTQPLPSTLTPGMYRPAASAIPNQQLAARLEFMEDLTSTELADLPDLIRRLMAERDSEWSFEDIIPVIDRWIELDAAGGFAFFSTEYPTPLHPRLPPPMNPTLQIKVPSSWELGSREFPYTGKLLNPVSSSNARERSGKAGLL